MPRYERMAWIVSYKDPLGAEPLNVIWLDEKGAYYTAAEFAKNRADEEISGLDWGEEGPPEVLREVIKAFESQQYQEAYLAWREYADKHQPDDDVKVIEAPIGEA